MCDDCGAAFPRKDSLHRYTTTNPSLSGGFQLTTSPDIKQIAAPNVELYALIDPEYWKWVHRQACPESAKHNPILWNNSKKLISSSRVPPRNGLFSLSTIYQASKRKTALETQTSGCSPDSIRVLEPDQDTCSASLLCALNS